MKNSVNQHALELPDKNKLTRLVSFLKEVDPSQFSCSRFISAVEYDENGNIESMVADQSGWLPICFPEFFHFEDLSYSSVREVKYFFGIGNELYLHLFLRRQNIKRWGGVLLNSRSPLSDVIKNFNQVIELI